VAKYIVNEHGVVHSIPNEWLWDYLMSHKDCREANDDEIASWYEAQGLDYIPENEVIVEKLKKFASSRKKGNNYGTP